MKVQRISFPHRSPSKQEVEKVVPNERQYAMSEHSWQTELIAGRATRRIRKHSKTWPPQGTCRQQFVGSFPGEDSEGPGTQIVYSVRESAMVIGAWWP